MLKVLFSKTAGLIRRFFDVLMQTRAGQVFLVFLGISIIFRWFYYIDQYSVNVLFYDMWTFYEPFFRGNSDFLELYTWQHGPHRQGIGFVLTKYLDKISDWNTRWVCFAIGIIIFFTSLIYLRVKKFLFGHLHYFDVIIFFIVLMPSQYGLFANTPNISHGAAPAVLLSIFCVSWFINRDILRYSALVLINFLLIYSAFGFLMGLITPLILLLDFWYYRESKRLRTIIFCAFTLATLSLASFFIDYKFNATANPSFKFPHDHPFEYLEYMVAMMARAISSKAYWGWVALGISSFIGIVHLRKLLKPRISNNEYVTSKIIIVLISFSFVFMVSTAIGRVSIGLAGAKASRYAVYILPAIVAVYFHTCSLRKTTFKLVAPFLLMFFVVKTTFIPYEVGMMRNFRNSKLSWKKTYLETESIEKASRNTPYGIHQDEEVRGQWLKSRLNYLKENDLNLYLEE